MTDKQDDNRTELFDESLSGDTIPASINAPLVGKMLDDRYLLLSSLGEGGMGHVYQATHVLMNKPVAIKLIHAELAHMEDVVKRFEREAKSSSRLSDPHCITVTDFGRTNDGTLFLVMELLDGDSLAAKLKEGSLEIEEALRITTQILKGLDHAHEQGVIHRDLKPENIHLCTFGEEKSFVKILDFGIAKLAHGEGSSDSLTKRGVVFGTPKYLSPEQALGEEVDHRADLYAVGIILFEMLTGQAPFQGESAMDIMSGHLTGPIPNLTTHGHFPRGLQKIIDKALAKKPAERFNTANDFLTDIERIDPSATPPSGVQRLLDKFVQTEEHLVKKKRSLVPFIVIAALLLSTLAAGAYLLFSDRDQRLDLSVIKEQESSLAPSPAPASASAPASAPAPANVKTLLEKAATQIANGNAPEAVVTAKEALFIEPNLAPAKFLLAHAQFLSGERTESMDLYKEALIADKTLRTDIRFKENLKEALNWKNPRLKAALLLAQYGDSDSIALLAGLSNSAITDGDKRRTARQALSEAGHDAAINWLDSLTADWHEQKRCKQRKEIIAAIEKTGDVRFLPLLEKYIPITKVTIVGKWRNKKKKTTTSNPCIGADILRAIETLRASEKSEPVQ